MKYKTGQRHTKEEEERRGAEEKQRWMEQVEVEVVLTWMLKLSQSLVAVCRDFTLIVQFRFTVDEHKAQFPVHCSSALQ